MTPTPRLIHLSANGPNDVGLTALDLDPADFQSPLPKQHWHLFYEDPAIGLTVGVWDTTTMQEAFGPYPGDEFIWVLEGGFAMIDANGVAHPAGPGDCVALRNGAEMSWKQDEYLRKFFITYVDPNAQPTTPSAADAAVVVMDPDAPMDIASQPGAPVERDHVAFTNDAGNMTVGLWSSETGEFEMEPFSVHEFVKVIEGEAVITEENGTVHTVTAGDCFFIPKGTVCSWKIPQFIKKYYAQVAIT
ncbi:MAG: cupin domain-containing protein [Sedimentitalea sp.]